MIRPTEQWAYEAAAKIQGLLLTSCPTNETIAAIILTACPFQPKWKEDKFQHEWNLKYPYPYLPHVRESELHPNIYYSVGTRYDTIDEAKIAAEEELMRRLKK